MSVNMNPDFHIAGGAIFEKHYRPEELATMWAVSADTIRRIFEKESGVLVFERQRKKTARRYRTLRIPESVALRVHKRMANFIAPANR